MEKAAHHHHLISGGGGGKSASRRGLPGTTGLQKQNSWSPDIERDESWERRRRALLQRKGSLLQRARSVTDEDIGELRGCIDLGFVFQPGTGGCPACDAGKSRLVETLPALDLYYAVHGGGGGGGEGAAVAAEGGCPCTCGGASEASSSEESPVGSPVSILEPGDTTETVKMRLKQWAQVVALTVLNRRS